MVYIPWQEYGICRFWMLQRCYQGGKCKWQHPAENEKKSLWDAFSAQQDADARRGIPRPVKPERKAAPNASDGVEGELKIKGASQQDGSFEKAVVDRGEAGMKVKGAAQNEALTQSPHFGHHVNAARAALIEAGQYGPGNVPPPPPPPRAYPPIQSATLPNLSPPRDPRRPKWDVKPAVDSLDTAHEITESSSAPVSEGTTVQERPDVSMLDAPASPDNDTPSALNKPMMGSYFNGMWAAPDGWRREDDDTFGVQNVGDTAFRGLPTREAVTLWKRGDSRDEIEASENRETRQIGGYWQRMKEQKRVEDEIKLFGAQAGMRPDPQNLRESLGRASLQKQLSHLTTSSSSLSSTTLRPKMGATKRLANGETKHVGPHPSIIRVSAPYMSQAAITKKLEQNNGQLDIQERSINEAREDSIRLQGCMWLDQVRRALQLPIRTFTTACTYYHKFRLAHAGGLNGMEYGNAWADACAASLLTSCKVEDTLKKSRDILAAAYNLKTTGHEQLAADDPVFDGPSRIVIGLERLVLEAGGFDFRSKYPHKLLVKLGKSMPDGGNGEKEKVARIAWTVLTDLHRTFVPLKQTSATMALASLELAADMYAASSEDNNSAVRDALQQLELNGWSTTREEVMETLIDALDLYTQHTNSTILGTRTSLDDFLRIRLAFNKECNENSIPRHTTAPSPEEPSIGNTLRPPNGHPTPVSPMEPGPQAPATNGAPTTPEGGGTVRFLLNPQLAVDEKTQVQKYFVEEWEEYDEEIEVPLSKSEREPKRPADQERKRDNDLKRSSVDRTRDTPRADTNEKDGTRKKDERDRDRDRDRDRVKGRDRNRDSERDRGRFDDRGRDRRFGDRRFDERDKRYDDRRERRYDDRRYDDERRRRDDRR